MGRLSGKGIVGLIATLLAGSSFAQTYPVRPDPVNPSPGSCTALKTYVANDGVKDSNRTPYPGYWGVTRWTLLYHRLRYADLLTDLQRGSMKAFDVVDRTRPGLAGTDWDFSEEANNFRFSLSVALDLNGIEWTHHFKKDSPCAREWQRVKAIIQSHERHHARDFERTVKEENTAIEKEPRITSHGKTRQEADVRLVRAVFAMVSRHRNRLIAKIEEETNALDAKERDPGMNCALCGKISVSGVEIVLTGRDQEGRPVTNTPTISGFVCGDPYEDAWTITTNWKVKAGSRVGLDQTAQSYDNAHCFAPGSEAANNFEKLFEGPYWYCIYSPGPSASGIIRTPKLTTSSGTLDGPKSRIAQIYDGGTCQK